MPLPETACQEEFSKAFLHALSAISGCDYSKPNTDYDSVDAVIAADLQGKAFKSPRIEIQLKCQKTDFSELGEHISYELGIKNYNDLRAQTALPRLLVLVQIPKERNDWISCNATELILNHYAHWTSLAGSPETPNTRSVTIKIPRANQLSKNTLLELLQKVADGEEL